MPNCTSNNVVVVANNANYEVYANGLQEPIITFSDSTHSGGKAFLVAWASNGENEESSCTFKDVWVWAPNS